MSSIKNENLQEVFLNQIRKEKVSVTLFLVNGVSLRSKKELSGKASCVSKYWYSGVVSKRLSEALIVKAFPPLAKPVFLPGNIPLTISSTEGQLQGGIGLLEDKCWLDWRFIIIEPSLALTDMRWLTAFKIFSSNNDIFASFFDGFLKIVSGMWRTLFRNSYC